MEKKKILIIDDNVDMVRILKLRLEMEGFEIITAGDGYEGIYKARTSGASLILLDLGLPGLPGEQICRELRKEEKYESLPIIMLTAKNSDTDKVIGRVLGANCYVRKPFEMDELLKNIKLLLKMK
ncbi:MAG: response regulator [Candidatus Omnitrophica bacterium]|nr:response regulator [Candidatus Omnitrophota bacterium]